MFDSIGIWIYFALSLGMNYSIQSIIGHHSDIVSLIIVSLMIVSLMYLIPDAAKINNDRLFYTPIYARTLIYLNGAIWANRRKKNLCWFHYECQTINIIFKINFERIFVGRNMYLMFNELIIARIRFDREFFLVWSSIT